MFKRLVLRGGFFRFRVGYSKMRLGASTSPKEALVVEDYTHSMGEL